MSPQSPTDQVVLGSLMSGARHGYEILQILGSALETTWRLSPSQLYVLLKRLEQKGCLESLSESRGTRPPKRVFTLTAEGRESFLEWVSAPVEHVRDFRMQFLCKLFFFDSLSLPGAEDLVNSQIRILEELLANIRRKPGKDPGGFAQLALGFKAGNIESLISWLRREARPFARRKRGPAKAVYRSAKTGALPEAGSGEIAR